MEIIFLLQECICLNQSNTQALEENDFELKLHLYFKKSNFDHGKHWCQRTTLEEQISYGAEKTMGFEETQTAPPCDGHV